MKKYSILAFILVLTLTLFCGCRGPMEEATGTPTMAPTLAPTAPSQPMPTQTQPTAPETTEGMMDPSDTLESTGAANGSEPGTSEGSAPGNGSASGSGSGGARMR